MGACTFFDVKVRSETIDSAHRAFDELIQEAIYDHGHNPYSGTIKEKTNFVFVGQPMYYKDARRLAEDMIDDEHPSIDDKWGPAGCIVLKPDNDITTGGWLFFGWASE